MLIRQHTKAVAVLEADPRVAGGPGVGLLMTFSNFPLIKLKACFHNK